MWSFIFQKYPMDLDNVLAPNRQAIIGTNDGLSSLEIHIFID